MRNIVLFLMMGLGFQTAIATDIFTTNLVPAYPNTPNIAKALVAATRAKTTTYTVVKSDRELILNSATAAFTVTMPSAASVAGQSFGFFKTNNDLNAITISATENINAATTTTMISQYEYLRIFSDGSQYYISDRRYPTASVAYTPTFSAGWGTVTNIAFTSARVGPFLKINGYFTSGTTAASSATFTLGYQGVNAPTNLNTDAIYNSNSNIVGTAGLPTSATTFFGQLTILAAPSVGTLGFGVASSTQNPVTVNTADQIGSNKNIRIDCEVLISGWL